MVPAIGFKRRWQPIIEWSCFDAKVSVSCYAYFPSSKRLLCPLACPRQTNQLSNLELQNLHLEVDIYYSSDQQSSS
jgi:hypothetical protein